MKTPLLVVVLLASAVPAARAQRDLQEQQASLMEAQKAAAQAADYAKQAASFNNQYAKLAAAYANEAANYARDVAKDVNYQEWVTKDVFYAKTAAANAKQAAEQAAIQAEIDSKVAKLEGERDKVVAKLAGARDEAVAKLRAKYSPAITDLESQLAALKSKANNLEKIRESSFVTNNNVKPGPNYRVVNGQTFDTTHSDLWKYLLEAAGFQSYNNANSRLVLYQARVQTVAPAKIICGVYEEALWPPVADGEVESEKMVQEIVIYHYPNAESLVTGQSIGDCRCMRVANYISGGISLVALDCGVQATKKITEVVPAPADPKTLKSIEDNQNQLYAVQQKLEKVENDFDKEREPVENDFNKEREPVIAEYEGKIKDVPDEVAKEVEAKEFAKKQAIKQAITDRVLKNNQDLADKGDAYGLLRMGERYRDGEGVPKDLAKARDYLTKAAEAGSQTASDELKTLPAN